MTTHPYRILVTSLGSRYVNLALVKAFPGFEPRTIKARGVQEVLYSIEVCRSPNTFLGSMPRRPEPPLRGAYELHLAKIYDFYDALIAAEDAE